MPGLSAIRTNTCGISVSPLTNKNQPLLTAPEFELREYEIFEGDYKSFSSEGKLDSTRIHAPSARYTLHRRKTDDEWRRDACKKAIRRTRRWRQLDSAKAPNRSAAQANALEEKYRAKPPSDAKNATTVKSALTQIPPQAVV